MFKRFTATLVCFAFIFSNLQYVYAQDFSIDQLPQPGSMINITPAFVPLTLKGLIIHPENALKFDFLMDTGHSHLKGQDLSDEALKIMKYFLTALTVPEDDLWVNLSPYEKARTIQKNFALTVMGRDLLAQDYVLKQLTSSLIDPDKDLGKEFWKEVYVKAAQKFGTTQVSVNTFNKVWIVPSEATVWEREGKVLIVKSHLKVMLEEDYLALQKSVSAVSLRGAKGDVAISKTHALASQITKTIILPVLEKEVNEGKNFAQLRQMFQAMILATWYKKALRKSIINKVYTDKEKIAGIGYKNSVIANEAKQSSDIDLIYQQYIKAFRKGAFNLIKEEIDPATGQQMPRKYFSGGIMFKINGSTNFAMGVTVLRTANPPAGSAQAIGEAIVATWQADPADASMTGLLSLFGRKEDKKNDKVKNGTRPVVAPPPNVSKSAEPLQQKKKTLEELLAIPNPTLEEVRAIGEFRSPLALSQLLKLSKDPDYFVSSAAVWGINELGDEVATPVLIEILNDPNGARLNAATYLGNKSDREDAKTALLEAFKKPLDRKLKERIGIAIGKIAIARGKKGDITFASDLSDFLERLSGYNERDNVTKEPFDTYLLGIAQAFVILGFPEKAVPALFRVLHSRSDFYKIAFAELVKIGEPAVPGLLKILENGKKEDVSIAEDVLKEIGEPAIPGLLQMLEESKSESASRVLYNLHWRPEIEQGQQLKLPFYSVPYHYTRKEWEELGELGKPATPFLLKALKYYRRGVGKDPENEEYLMAIIFALGRTGDPRAVPDLLALSGDSIYSIVGFTRHEKTQVVTYDAAIKFAILRIGQAAIPALLQGAQYEDASIRIMSQQMLKQIRDLKMTPIPKQNTNDIIDLIRLLRHDSSKDRLEAIKTLEQKKDRGAIEYLLIRLMSDRRKEVCVAAAKAVLSLGGYENADVVERLLERDVPEAHGTILRFLDRAIEYKIQGYDFYVQYQRSGDELSWENNEGVRRSATTDEHLNIIQGFGLSNKAMLPSPDKHLGGISLNSKMLDLNIRNKDNAMSLPTNQRFLENINFQGFFPRLISIHSVDLPGLFESNSSSQIIVSKIQ